MSIIWILDFPFPIFKEAVLTAFLFAYIPLVASFAGIKILVEFFSFFKWMLRTLQIELMDDC